jgi:hypothetical protein
MPAQAPSRSLQATLSPPATADAGNARQTSGSDGVGRALGFGNILRIKTADERTNQSIVTLVQLPTDGYIDAAASTPSPPRTLTSRRYRPAASRILQEC